MSTKSTDKIRWSRVVCVVLVILLVFELWANVFFFRWAGERYRSLRPYHWSPYGLVRSNPEITSPSFHINENGFRNEETFTKKKPENTLRVIIMGASVMYSGLGGWFPADTVRVNTDETIGKYLEQKLRDDPELAGLEIEILNAAVNFNRINEVCSAYVDEYVFWKPDFVIAGGSANNFVIEPPRKGAIYANNYNVQTWHPWRAEFERQVNDMRFVPLVERTVLTFESYFALAALSRKLSTRFNDKLTSLSSTLGHRLRGKFTFPQPTDSKANTDRFADSEEYDAYINNYLSFVNAMKAVSAMNNQELAFYWEYYLVQLKDIKPLSEAEKILYQGNLNVRPLVADPHYNFRARDRIAEFCSKNDTTFVDPINELKTFEDSVYIDYIHYTPTGNKFVADVLYDRLKDQFHQRAREIKADSK